MSVLIENMEMPENCFDCPLSAIKNDDVLICWANDGKKIIREDVTMCRYEYCPLVEVKTQNFD